MNNPGTAGSGEQETRAAQTAFAAVAHVEDLPEAAAHIAAQTHYEEMQAFVVTEDTLAALGPLREQYPDMRIPELKAGHVIACLQDRRCVYWTDYDAGENVPMAGFVSAAIEPFKMRGKQVHVAVAFNDLFVLPQGMNIPLTPLKPTMVDSVQHFSNIHQRYHRVHSGPFGDRAFA